MATTAALNGIVSSNANDLEGGMEGGRKGGGERERGGGERESHHKNSTVRELKL